MRNPDWREVAPDVFVRAYDHLDVNVTVVRGAAELLVVDSRSSPTEAAELEADLQAFAPARTRALVNTHAHFDHTFGNQRFGPGSALDVPVYGHHRLPAHLDEHERPRLGAWWAGTGGEPDRDWADVRVTPPTHLVASPRVVHVGGRPVRLHPLGRGHTDTDLVVHVPDADVWIVGDVVETAGPPVYGSGCFPLDLPHQLAELLALLAPGDVVVPGHGPVVDRDAVRAQHAEVEELARQVRAAHRAGTRSSRPWPTRAAGPSPSRPWTWPCGGATSPSPRTAPAGPRPDGCPSRGRPQGHRRLGPGRQPFLAVPTCGLLATPTSTASGRAPVMAA